MISFFKLFFSSSFPPALSRMRLAPDGATDNPLMLQFFTWDYLHPILSWWSHLEEEIPRLAEMGVTQLWLPPPNKAAEPMGRGYDVYDLWDLGEFERKGGVKTRWGTKEELLRACALARAHGIDILIDAVLNHKLGADALETFPAVPVDPDNRLKDIGPVRDIEGWTLFNFPGRKNKYSTFRWRHEHFTGVDWDQKVHSKGIYRIATPGRKGWSRNVDTELGNYDFLLGIDIDHRHPAVQEDLINWGCWVLDTMEATGFRLDAIKHIDRNFVLQFLQKIRQKPGNERMFVVSEYWSGNFQSIMPYIRALKGETAFFDVPLHMNFCQASRQRTRYDLRKIMKRTIVDMRPGDAVTFVDNHDTVEGQSLESWVEHNFKTQAYAIILLRDNGYPCVFYGDIYPNNEGYQENTARHVKMLISARKKYAYGALIDYPAQPNCIGFVRSGDALHPGCAVVISNKEDESGTVLHNLRMSVGKVNAGATYCSILSQHGRVVIDKNGWGDFSCFANHVQVWVKEEETSV